MNIVGLIGLGAMGLGIAQTLRSNGYEVHVCDVRPGAAAAFAEGGGVAHATPADVGAACDVVVSVVVNAAQTEAVLYGEHGAAATMRAGSTFVMCSTVDPNWSVALEQRLNASGLHYIDAPISGGAAKAASGQMTVMSAAKPEAYARAGAVLDAMAGKVYRLGDSAGNSWMFENRMAHVLAADYTPLSAVDIFVKDLGLVLDTARASKFPLPLASTAHQMFMQASTAGFAKEDDSAVIKIFPGITLPGATKQ
jgi:3-hydroxyisobutyrate dehydrogenase